jgi:hypothetical protein
MYSILFFRVTSFLRLCFGNRTFCWYKMFDIQISFGYKNVYVCEGDILLKDSGKLETVESLSLLLHIEARSATRRYEKGTQNFSWETRREDITWETY